MVAAIRLDYLAALRWNSHQPGLAADGHLQERIHGFGRKMSGEVEQPVLVYCRRLKRSAGMWRRGWISSDGAGWVMAGRGA
jgi:protein tyrosine phosphatase (PTP) superfamily phosphohydrolase (DUF442 family)